MALDQHQAHGLCSEHPLHIQRTTPPDEAVLLTPQEGAQAVFPRLGVCGDHVGVPEQNERFLEAPRSAQLRDQDRSVLKSGRRHGARRDPVRLKERAQGSDRQAFIAWRV